eukprot:scpid99234/ scgid2157/ 
MNASNLCVLSVAVICMVLAWSEPSKACGSCTCSNGVVMSCPNIANISLRSNGLTNLSGSAFQNNKNVTNIDLYGNQLVHLPDGLFQATTKLQDLYLQKNNLRYLPGGLPHDTPHLIDLYLEHAVSLNLRLCAFKFPKDFSQGAISIFNENSHQLKNYIASNLTEANCRQHCSIISDLDKCDLCTGYLYNYTCIERDECLH